MDNEEVMAIAIARAVGESKTYTDTLFDAVKGGLKYQGSVNTVSDLPTPTSSIKGHMYTVASNGHEWVCDGTQWIDLQQELSALEQRVHTLETVPLYPRG